MKILKFWNKLYELYLAANQTDKRAQLFENTRKH